MAACPAPNVARCSRRWRVPSVDRARWRPSRHRSRRRLRHPSCETSCRDHGSANGHDVVEGQLSTWSEPARSAGPTSASTTRNRGSRRQPRLRGCPRTRPRWPRSDRPPTRHRPRRRRARRHLPRLTRSRRPHRSRPSRSTPAGRRPLPRRSTPKPHRSPSRPQRPSPHRRWRHPCLCRARRPRRVPTCRRSSDPPVAGTGPSLGWPRPGRERRGRGGRCRRERHDLGQQRQRGLGRTGEVERVRRLARDRGYGTRPGRIPPAVVGDLGHRRRPAWATSTDGASPAQGTSSS